MDNESLYDVDLEIPEDEYTVPGTETGFGHQEPLSATEQALNNDDLEISGEQESSELSVLDPLGELPLELTLRCGQVTLTLDQLRRLDAGAVVEVSGVAPGYASLCHGDRIIAEGELVDVNGRLGLQITQMASHP